MREKRPIIIGDAQVTLGDEILVVKGKKGELNIKLVKKLVDVQLQDNTVKVKPIGLSTQAIELTGTLHANLANAITGVNQGFEEKLVLVGVGYRANVQGNKINLTLGFSHPVVYDIPAGITIETPIPTEIVIKGTDRQLVGQVAAEIRRYRPPEAYKGKGVRYAGERIKLKETKKK
jgi:large subunit ribosomal protein L6